jgi:hypothetical protein
MTYKGPIYGIDVPNDTARILAVAHDLAIEGFGS